MSNKERSNRAGILFVVSAPSGAGKTTLCRMAVDYFKDLLHSVSYTTRPRRDSEREGVDYHFIADLTFDEMLEKGEFLEWAYVHGNRYGTSRKTTESIVRGGDDLILDIDVQGANQLRNSDAQGVFIFILPPSLSECVDRLRRRGAEKDDDISLRASNAVSEIKKARNYDYLIVNDKLEQAFGILKSIIIAERVRSIHFRDNIIERLTIF